MLTHAFQDYVSHILPDAGIPSPGPLADFDPAQSPLVQEMSSRSDALFPLTISDATGQEFTFDAPPRLGCLWYGCHEIMADLGLAPTASSIGLDQRESPFFFPSGPTPRYGCCSLRGFIFALQQYGHHVYAGANIPDPGPLDNFDPLQSILVNAQ